MKRFLMVLLTICILALSSCSDDVKIPDGMQLASDDSVSYNLFVPGGWILTESNGIYGAYYSSSDRSSMTMSSIHPDEGMASVEEYWNTCKTSYDRTYKNFEASEEQTETLMGEKTAYKYVFSAEIDGESYKFMQLITVHGGKFYTFVYTSTAENYEAHLADVEKTLSEIIFK